MISLDTETTGIDFKHGCKPFFVSICNEQHEVTYWQWSVDPLTRQPIIPPEDLDEIHSVIQQEDKIVIQNSKFDVSALDSIGLIDKWDWQKTEDTLIAGHLIASKEPHDLASMSLMYLGIDIKQYEEKLNSIVNEARRLARKKYPNWRLAKEGDPTLPSVKGDSKWKLDMWLPAAIADAEDYPDDHPYRKVLPLYGNGDSSITLPLFQKQLEIIQERDQEELYRERLKLLEITYVMEQQGISMSMHRLNELYKTYTVERDKAETICLKLSDGHLDKMPKGGTSKALRSTIFDYFDLPIIKRSKKTNEPSIDKISLEQWEATLPRNKSEYHFVKNLRSARKRGTAIGYMDGYKKIALVDDRANCYDPNLPEETMDWYVLHPNLNITGTDTLRMSSNNPNEQNISKKEGFNLRYCFGPRPGREWWAGDYNNIELRLPAFKSGETEMVNLFLRPDDSPYYGSYHLLVCDVLHPEKFAKHGKNFKNEYASSWYQWTKNGNFAVQYGAMEESGTADMAYHVKGAQSKIKERFKKITELNASSIQHAEDNGYVYTFTNKGFKTGYPLECPKTDYGRVKPTVPLNYVIQGSAMWAMSRAMTRCFDYLRNYPGYYMIMQIHDELVFDFPAKRTNDWDSTSPENGLGNLEIIKEIKRLMELSGEDFNLPLPTGWTYHPYDWSTGYDLEI